MRVLDLFIAAAGGWSLGMHRAGFRTVYACALMPRYMEPETPVCFN